MVLFHLGSDDGGVSWRELKSGENAKLYVAICERGDAEQPRTLEEAIKMACANAPKMHAMH